MIETDLRDLTVDQIKERLRELQDVRKQAYTQPERKKARANEPTMDPKAAEILLKKIEEAGSLEALLAQIAAEDAEATDDGDS